MKREIGDLNFPIWLIGDSEPENWKNKLDAPLDYRHPIRHNIWTSIIDLIQNKMYTSRRLRIDTSKIYIRNAVDNENKKPKDNEIEWKNEILEEVKITKKIIEIYDPEIIITFGAFAYEFMRRVFQTEPKHSIKYWNTKRMGEMFIKSMENEKIVPLLHRSIAAGNFIVSHENFCNGKCNNNYFENVAENLFNRIIKLNNIYIS